MVASGKAATASAMFVTATESATGIVAIGTAVRAVEEEEEQGEAERKRRSSAGALAVRMGVAATVMSSVAGIVAGGARKAVKGEDVADTAMA